MTTKGYVISGFVILMALGGIASYQEEQLKQYNALGQKPLKLKSFTCSSSRNELLHLADTIIKNQSTNTLRVRPFAKFYDKWDELILGKETKGNMEYELGPGQEKQVVVTLSDVFRELYSFPEMKKCSVRFRGDGRWIETDYESWSPVKLNSDSKMVIKLSIKDDEI